nr:uncharacterized protein LOC129266842 [Lytechinus pictus]
MDDIFNISMLSSDVSYINIEEEPPLEPTTCKCTGSCWYKTGKRMCPCRSAGHPCTQRCSCGKRRLCANREPEGNESSDTDETDGEPLSKSIRPTTIAQARQDSHAVSVKKFVMDLQRADLERVTVQLLCRFPDVY